VFGASHIDDDFYEELEETFIMADMGYETTEKVIENLKEKLYRGIATRADITRITRRLGDEIAKVHGFPIPRQRRAAEQER
jgi:signal recognition particle GTPase